MYKTFTLNMYKVTDDPYLSAQLLRQNGLNPPLVGGRDVCVC